MHRLALTFDDGPDPVGTPRLLALLLRLKAKATFFPIASRATAHPRLIAAMLAHGHAVGVHCDRHLRHSQRSQDSLTRDTAAALTSLRALGARPSLWRTPWGDLAPWSAQVARQFNLRIVGWTVDTHDWRGDRAQSMLAAIEPALTSGTVVLAHDGIGPGARRDTIEQTLALVEAIARLAPAKGLMLEALEALEAPT